MTDFHWANFIQLFKTAKIIKDQMDENSLKFYTMYQVFLIILIFAL